MSIMPSTHKERRRSTRLFDVGTIRDRLLIASVDTISRSAVRELGRPLRASDAWIELELGDRSENPGQGEIVDDTRRMPPEEDGDGARRGEPARGERSS